MKTLFFTILLSSLFISCSSTKLNDDKSSYNKKAIQHQMDKAKEAYKELE